MLIFRLVNQFVLSDPWHHLAQLRADLLDVVGGELRARRLERGLVDLVLQHPVAGELAGLDVLVLAHTFLDGIDHLLGIAQATGGWTTSGRTAVVQADLTADDVKGWMTIQHAADGLGEQRGHRQRHEPVDGLVLRDLAAAIGQLVERDMEAVQEIDPDRQDAVVARDEVDRLLATDKE